MDTFVTVIHVIVCIFLVLVILLQAGKGAGMGVLGGASQTVFGGRGATTFLGKMTGTMAALFILTSLYLDWSASKTEDPALKARAEAATLERKKNEEQKKIEAEQAKAKAKAQKAESKALNPTDAAPSDATDAALATESHRDGAASAIPSADKTEPNEQPNPSDKKNSSK